MWACILAEAAQSNLKDENCIFSQCSLSVAHVYSTNRILFTSSLDQGERENFQFSCALFAWCCGCHNNVLPATDVRNNTNLNFAKHICGVLLIVTDQHLHAIRCCWCWVFVYVSLCVCEQYARDKARTFSRLELEYMNKCMQYISISMALILRILLDCSAQLRPVCRCSLHYWWLRMAQHIHLQNGNEFKFMCFCCSGSKYTHFKITTCQI